MIAVVDFPNLRGVDVIEEARQRILSTFRAYTTGLLLCHNKAWANLCSCCPCVCV